MSPLAWITLCLCLGFLSPELVFAQDSFTVPIECYNCIDKLVNTTCGDPQTDAELDILDTITCKTGACVKWTYYKNNELIMRRTCSLEININIHLNHVCQDESYGNGYLCMCDKDLCNGAESPSFRLPMLGSSFLMLAVVHEILNPC